MTDRERTPEQAQEQGPSGQQSGSQGEAPTPGAIIIRHSLPGRAFVVAWPTRRV